MFTYAFLSVLAVSALSLVGAFTLTLKEKVLKSLIFVLVSMSAGALFGDAFIHLIPEAFSGALSPDRASLYLLIGILFFFMLEKFLHWRHSHGIDEESGETGSTHDHSKKNVGIMVLVGDAIHNLIDGVIIGASFLVSVEVGVATTLAVALHEIPQEIGDFGLLIHSGLSRGTALLFNFLSGLASLLALALAFAAGGFVYIAGSDLVPEIQKTKELKKSLIQVLSMVVGILAMMLLLYFE